MATKIKGPYEEVTISEDGEVFTAKIVGVKGKACEKLQKKFQQMGTLTDEQKTPEFFEQSTPIAVNTQVTNRGFGR